jgi:5-methylcytosine-specific restriction endonuclease McrA
MAEDTSTNLTIRGASPRCASNLRVSRHPRRSGRRATLRAHDRRRVGPRGSEAVAVQVKLCARCTRRMQPGRALCTDCQQADDRRRNTRRRLSGRTTAAWQRLRLAAFYRDGYACQRCSRTGTRHTLTVHLDPALEGNHWIATLDDLTTLCRSCHGSIDAPRARSS